MCVSLQTCRAKGCPLQGTSPAGPTAQAPHQTGCTFYSGPVTSTLTGRSESSPEFAENLEDQLSWPWIILPEATSLGFQVIHRNILGDDRGSGTLSFAGRWVRNNRHLVACYLNSVPWLSLGISLYFTLESFVFYSGILPRMPEQSFQGKAGALGSNPGKASTLLCD